MKAVPRAQAITLFRHYAVAVATALFALILRLFLFPVLGEQTPFILFFPAVVISSLYGGLGPGLVATALAAGASATSCCLHWPHWRSVTHASRSLSRCLRPRVCY